MSIELKSKSFHAHCADQYFMESDISKEDIAHILQQKNIDALQYMSNGRVRDWTCAELYHGLADVIGIDFEKFVWHEDTIKDLVDGLYNDLTIYHTNQIHVLNSQFLTKKLGLDLRCRIMIHGYRLKSMISDVYKSLDDTSNNNYIDLHKKYLAVLMDDVYIDTEKFLAMFVYLSLITQNKIVLPHSYLFLKNADGFVENKMKYILERHIGAIQDVVPLYANIAIQSKHTKRLEKIAQNISMPSSIGSFVGAIAI